MEEITIVVADDHLLFRQGIINTLSLEPGFKIVGQAANGAEAIMMIRTLHPHVAVVDFNLSGMNGQQVTHQVVQDKLSTRIVLLTAFGDHEQIILVGWAGAAAYCAKDIDPKQLVQTVKAVVNVKFVIENRVFNQKEFDYWINDEIWRKRVSFAASQAALSTHFLSAKRCT